MPYQLSPGCRCASSSGSHSENESVYNPWSRACLTGSTICEWMHRRQSLMGQLVSPNNASLALRHSPNAEQQQTNTRRASVSFQSSGRCWHLGFLRRCHHDGHGSILIAVVRHQQTHRTTPSKGISACFTHVLGAMFSPSTIVTLQRHPSDFNNACHAVHRAESLRHPQQSAFLVAGNRFSNGQVAKVLRRGRCVEVKFDFIPSR